MTLVQGNSYTGRIESEAVTMDIFDYMRSSTQERESPLASRLRPTTLDEVVGQKHIIGKD